MRSYQAKLAFSSNEERDRLIKTLEAQREMFDECSKDLYGFLQKNEHASIMDIHKMSYRRIRTLFPNVPSQMVIRAEHDCKSAYQAIKSNRHQISCPITKKGLSVQLDERIYSWKKDAIRVSAIGGTRVECQIIGYDKLNKMFATHEVRDPAIFVRKGEIFINIPFVTPNLLHVDNHCVGIDLGCRMLAVTSEGKAISGKELGKYKRKMRFLRAQLRSQASKGSKSAKRHLKKISRRERGFSLNYSHHVVNELLKTEANTIVMENLAGLRNKKSRFQSKGKVSQIPFYQIKFLMTYKAQALGKRVVTVSSRNTSKEDCRGIENGERAGRRYYSRDGTVLDAEINAAINIAKSFSMKSSHGQHPVSLVYPFDGSLKPYGQAAVSRPIVESVILMSDHLNCVDLQTFTGS